VNGTTITYQDFDYDGHWTTYLMFKPSGTDSSWVTLNKLNWVWHGAATFNRGSSPHQWTETSITEPMNPSGSDSTEYPVWSQVQTDSRGCGF
jgi:hypothetical protein